MRRVLLAMVICLAATGCRHRQPQYVAVALPPPVPVVLDASPLVNAPLVQPVPVPALPATDVKLPKKVKKPKKKVLPAATGNPPVQVAGDGAPVPAANVVGALSGGGEGSPEKHKQAEDLLAALEKRLAALPGNVAEGEKAQLSRVKYFWGEAKSALLAGDAEGALTLATKAKVLLDDVVQ